MFLMKENILKEYGVIMCTSDGALSQYICDTAYYFLSTLAYKYKITIDRFISAPGHGKGIFDGINGVTERELTIVSGRELMYAAEAHQVSAAEDHQVYTKIFGGYVMRYGVHSSAAAYCKILLENDGTAGAKSDRKYNKREQNRGIQNMHFHIRNHSKTLSLMKCGPPKLAKRVGGKLAKG